MKYKLNPDANDYVKILFKDRNVVEEGVVVFWSDEKAVLKSLNSDDLLIIQKPVENILAVKISVKSNQPTQPIQPAQPTKPVLNVAVTDDLVPDKYYRDETLRALSLVKLRQKQAEEERKNAKKLLTTFKPSGLPPGEYARQSDFLQSLSQHSKKKT